MKKDVGLYVPLCRKTLFTGEDRIKTLKAENLIKVENHGNLRIYYPV